MNTRLNQKVVRGELVEVIESSGGFLGGTIQRPKLYS